MNKGTPFAVGVSGMIVGCAVTLFAVFLLSSCASDFAADSAVAAMEDHGIDYVFSTQARYTFAFATEQGVVIYYNGSLFEEREE